MIQLTHYQVATRKYYFNPSGILVMYRDGETYTTMVMNRDSYYVAETPEEILALIANIEQKPGLKAPAIEV